MIAVQLSALKVGDWRNFVGIHPKKIYLHFTICVQQPEVWITKLEEAGLPVTKLRQNRIRVTIYEQQFDLQKPFLAELIAAAIRDDELET